MGNRTKRFHLSSSFEKAKITEKGGGNDLGIVEENMDLVNV